MSVKCRNPPQGQARFAFEDAEMNRRRRQGSISTRCTCPSLRLEDHSRNYDGCGSNAESKDYSNQHFQSLWSEGQPTMIRQNIDVQARFLSTSRDDYTPSLKQAKNIYLYVYDAVLHSCGITIYNI
jgi:hypothetical protein